MRREDVIVSIPLIDKHHCCNDCAKNCGGFCTIFKKPTSDVALDCEPLPEWEKPATNTDQEEEI